MGLQVRLVHALADRVMDLEPAAGGGPLVIGRANEADVHIPSLNVSRRHALLHFREGVWVLQDGGGGRGTFVNGKSLTGAVKLKSGDVVTLGSDPTPVTLVIDPYATAGTGKPAVADDPPTAHHRRAASPGSALPQPTAPAPAPAPPSKRPVRQPVGPVADPNDPFGQESVATNPADATDDWMAAAASQARSTSHRRPPKQKMGTGLIVTTVVLTVLIIGGSVWLIAKKLRDGPTVVVVNTNSTTKPTTGTPPRKGAATEAIAGPQTQPAGDTAGGAPGGEHPGPTVAGSSNGSTPPDPSSGRAQLNLPPELSGKTGTPAGKAPGAAAMDEDLNPGGPPIKASAAAADRYWAGVEEAHNTAEPATAVVIYEDYMRLFPDGMHLTEVHQFMEESLDQLWWQRISDLMKKQQDLQKDMLKKDTEIAAETSTEFKEKLNTEKADLTKEIEAITNELKAMKYELQDPPNTHDPAAIKLLRQGRDAQVFDVWKKQVHLNIKTSRGAKIF